MGSGAGGIYAETYGSGSVRRLEADGGVPGRRAATSKKTAPHTDIQGSSVERNIESIDKKFKLGDDGYLCERGTGRDDSFRQFVSGKPNEDAHELFDGLSKGGETELFDGGMGLKTTLDDMTRVVYREQTRTPGSPAVSIGRSASPKIKNQKIHFIEEGQK